MQSTLNIGLIGAGRIGKIHAKNINLHPFCNLFSVTDALESAAKELAEQYNAKAIDINDVFNHDDIDALIIASPTDTHADYIELACKHNLPLLCEKPIDNELDRAKQCIESINQHDNTCALAFNRRHDPQFKQLKSEIENKSIGDLEILVITSRDPSPPPVSYIKSSGGLFKDMSIHDLDIARWMLGEKIVEVHAFGSNLVDKEIGNAGDIDTAIITLKTESGKLCHINNSRRAVYGYDQRIEAFGSKGMLQAENFRHTPLLKSTESGTAKEPLLDFFLERYEQAYINELEDFYQSITNKTPPLASPIDGLEALKLAEAAIESCQSGQSIKLA